MKKLETELSRKSVSRKHFRIQFGGGAIGFISYRLFSKFSNIMKNNKKNNIYPFVVFYDGYCILCSKSIDFIIKHDKKEKLLFASLQSKYASETLSEMGYNPQDIAKLDNVIYLTNGVIKIKSSAVISILSDIKGIYKLCNIFYIIPQFIRDFIYDEIALRRYKWFGKRETCRIPTKEEKLRILD